MFQILVKYWFKFFWAEEERLVVERDFILEGVFEIGGFKAGNGWKVQGSNSHLAIFFPIPSSKGLCFF